MTKKDLPIPDAVQIIIQNPLFFIEYYIKLCRINYGVLLSILIMVCSTGFAQIKIREKISLNPTKNLIKSPNFYSSNSAMHSLRAVHNWEPNYLNGDEGIPLNRMRFKISANFCNRTIYSDYDYSGTLDFTTVDLLGTSYSVQLLLSSRTQWDPEFKNEHIHGASFQIYVDGELKTSSNDYWFGYLGVDISGSTISYDDFGSDVYTYTLKSCDPIIGRLNEDYPYITISEGGEYLSFYDEVLDDTIGNSYYLGDYLNGGQIPLLIYDEPYFKEKPFYGKIEVSVNGYTSIDSVKIEPVDEFDLLVETDPGKIVPGNESQISLSYLSIFGDTIQFPDSHLFDIELIEGADFGVLVSGNNSDTADAFNSIGQPFSFRAKESIALDSAEIIIKVTTKVEDDYLITGDDRGKFNNSKKAIYDSSPEPKIRSSIEKDENQNNLAIIFPPLEPREIFGIGRVIIENRDSIDHFEITIVPDTLSEKDTLAFSETAALFVQAKDKDSNDVDLDSDEYLNFAIISNEDYGTFLDAKGDTLKSDHTMLENVKYVDAKDGKIKFAAVRENPDSIELCEIKVSLSGDTSIFGIHHAVVLEHTLRIIIDQSLGIQPIITGRRYDPENDTYLNNIRNENRIDFRILHTRGGFEVKNHSIKLTSDYIDGSGGHDHITPRRPADAFSYSRNGTLFNIPAERARRQNYGSFYAVRGEAFNTDSLYGKEFIRSRSDTVARFQYIASIWGDSMKICLRSRENFLLNCDSVVIAEKIPDLTLLEEGENYILYGGTAYHNGPPTYESDHNHYGTTILCSAIKQIASDYQTFHPSAMIRINDMSLENGGKFDINGNWRGSHAQHREGKNVDISGSVIIHNKLVNIKRRKMREIICDITGISPIFHNPPHFHIYTR